MRELIIFIACFLIGMAIGNKAMSADLVLTFTPDPDAELTACYRSPDGEAWELVGETEGDELPADLIPDIKLTCYKCTSKLGAYESEQSEPYCKNRGCHNG